MLCGRAGGRAARPRAPGCRPRRGSRFSRGSKIYAQGVYFWAYMEVLKGISSFKRPIRRACVGAGTGHSGPGSRQRTAAPPRPGHSLREYMQPALASASVEVAQTAGGCDSRRRARQEKPPPPARSWELAAALGARTTALGYRRVVSPPSPPEGWAASRPRGL